MIRRITSRISKKNYVLSHGFEKEASSLVMRIFFD